VTRGAARVPGILRAGLLLVAPALGCAHAQPAVRPDGPDRRADVRPQIEAALRSEVAPLRGREDVSAYLEYLRARAVAQQQVTALEVEPGVAAIERLEPELGSDAVQEWIARFTQSMAALSQGEK
jgi:hypothetical protein